MHCMMKMNYIVIYILLFCLLGCNNKRKEEFELLLKNYRKLSQEIIDLGQESFHARFPNAIKVNHQGELVKDDNFPFIKKISMIPSSKKQYKIKIEYFASTTSIKPKFDIYFFNKQGLNIHVESIEYKGKLLRKTLPINKSVEEEYTLTIFGRHRPFYLVLKKVIN